MYQIPCSLADEVIVWHTSAILMFDVPRCVIIRRAIGCVDTVGMSPTRRIWNDLLVRLAYLFLILLTDKQCYRIAYKCYAHV